uniref:BrnA antitoxin family protein n=1 Tax=Endozoicomonas sp. Mp262 TaxID=2919499 RepID=UPI00351AF37A
MKKNDLTPSQKRELQALADKPDAEIDTSDIPEIADWDKAETGKLYRPVKQQVSIRLDADVLAWFKAKHPKYQTALNQALREYMESHSV